MIELSGSDRRVIEHLRKAGILQELEDHRIDHRGGAIAVTCSDGDQFDDLYNRHSKLCAAHRPNTRIHPLSLNGGALLIAADSPLIHKALREDQVYLHHLKKALAMMDIKTIALYGHSPCRAAYGAGLSVVQAIALTFAAKNRIEAESNGSKAAISCFHHVDYSKGRKRTYFVSPNHWARFYSD